MTITNLNYTLETHHDAYLFSCKDAAVSILFGLSGVTYAQRHWELARQPSFCAHMSIAFIEFIPVLGGLAALLERIAVAVYRCLYSTPSSIPSSAPSSAPLKATETAPFTEQPPKSDKQTTKLIKDFSLVSGDQIELLGSSLSSRAIYIVKIAHSAERIFIKSPNPRRKLRGESTAVCDELAYVISRDFNLNVVPATKALEKDRVKTLNPKMVQLSRARCVIQREVRSGPVKCDKGSHFQKFILFNLLLGRRDANDANNVSNEDGMLIAIDNEEIGRKTTDNYCVLDNQTLEFNNEVIEDFLKHHKEDIDQGCLEVEEDDPKRTINESYKKTIKENYEIIYKIFTDHPNRKIAVGDLTTALMRQK